MTLAYLGYGTERGSFYYVDTEIEEEVLPLHLATVTLAPEQVLPSGLVIPTDLIQAELAAYIGDFRDSEFAWEVTETTPLVFSVPFPLAELLQVCSHDFFRSPINKFLISVHAVTVEPEPVSSLEKVWVLVYSLPRGGRAAPRGGKLTHILKAISEPVGKLVTADLSSFEDDGPARIEILYHAPAEIDGMSLIFYFGSKGRRLTFELESLASVDLLGSAPGATDGRDGNGARLGRAPPVRRMMLMAGTRRPRLMAGVPRSPLPLSLPVLSGRPPGWRQGLSPWSSPSLPVSPLTWWSWAGMRPWSAAPCRYHSGLPRDRGGGRAECGDGGVPFVIAALAGGGLLLVLAEVPLSSHGVPDREPPPPLDLVLTVVTPAAAGHKARGGTSPLVSARQSARLSQSRLLLDGRVPTIQEKATLRAAARDPSLEVATDSGILFRGEKGPILEQISAICAKEKLEGALAEARACAAHGDPSSHEPTDPGHRETRGGATPSMVPVAGTSLSVPSPLRVLRGRPPHVSIPLNTVSRCVGIAPGPPPSVWGTQLPPLHGATWPPV
ncbi:hypothetical protein D1007_59621 [Hordeum vulgare]|nr:hypothetical protein D1007_59621 [Hordeum vulgare]